MRFIAMSGRIQDDCINGKVTGLADSTFKYQEYNPIILHLDFVLKEPLDQASVGRRT